MDGRSGFIDTLRGISIWLVIIRHIDIRIPFSKSPWAGYLPDSLLSLFVSGGGFGVRIFFVVSGFLITSISLKRWHGLDRINARHFYQLRFARIMPCLLALLCIATALHLLDVPGYVINPARASLGEAWLAALGLHVNWLEANRGYLPASWDVLWTLSIEELFYLLFPPILLLLKKPFPVALVLLAFIVMGPFARTDPSANDYWQSKSYLACMDGIAIGCLAGLAVYYRWFGLRARRLLLFGGGSVFVAILFFNLRFPHGLTATFLALSVACLLAVEPRWQGLRVARYFGKSSYEVYLTHMFVILTGTKLFQSNQIDLVWAPAWYLGLIALSGWVGDLTRTHFSERLNAYFRPGATKP